MSTIISLTISHTATLEFIVLKCIICKRRWQRWWQYGGRHWEKLKIKLKNYWQWLQIIFSSEDGYFNFSFLNLFHIQWPISGFENPAKNSWDLVVWRLKNEHTILGSLLKLDLTKGPSICELFIVSVIKTELQLQYCIWDLNCSQYTCVY